MLKLALCASELILQIKKNVSRKNILLWEEEKLKEGHGRRLIKIQRDSPCFH